MPAYTSNLRLSQPAIGETNWGETINNGLTALLDDALTRTTTLTLQDADYTLTALNGGQDESRSMFIAIVGAATATRKVTCPSLSKLYFVRNSCAVGISFGTASGSFVTVPPGKSMALQCDGQNVISAIDYVPATSHAHDQSIASATWNITHNLNKYPSVTITDSAGDEVEGEVRYNGANSLTVKFSAPFAGKAYLN